MKIGIIGNGFVGKATKILQCKDIEMLCYDINPELCEPKHLKLKDVDCVRILSLNKYIILEKYLLVIL